MQKSDNIDLSSQRKELMDAVELLAHARHSASREEGSSDEKTYSKTVIQGVRNHTFTKFYVVLLFPIWCVCASLFLIPPQFLSKMQQIHCLLTRLTEAGSSFPWSKCCLLLHG